jgi:phosphate transport system protein
MTLRLEESLQRDINRIQGKIHEMAEIVGHALRSDLSALADRNRQLAYSVILRDQRIDEMEKEIDRLCLEFLVRQQPSGRHLRLAYATIKINAELERIGDYAVSIARQIIKINHIDSLPSFALFTPLADISLLMLGDAIRAFVEQNAELAKETMHLEDKADLLRNQIDAELLRQQQEGKIQIEAFTPLLTIARRFERVADQAKNICEEVLYLCTGEFAKHKDTETIRILFLDEHNACRSQMAETIGNSLGQPQLLFSSAGIEPRSLDPATIQFLNSKGLSPSRQAPKSVEQLPNLEHYQVVVALATEARRVFSALPAKAVTLDWSVADPSTTRGTPEQVRAAYEHAFQYIETHIKDLCEAILGKATELPN